METHCAEHVPAVHFSCLPPGTSNAGDARTDGKLCKPQTPKARLAPIGHRVGVRDLQPRPDTILFSLATWSASLDIRSKKIYSVGRACTTRTRNHDIAKGRAIFSDYCGLRGLEWHRGREPSTCFVGDIHVLLAAYVDGVAPFSRPPSLSWVLGLLHCVSG